MNYYDVLFAKKLNGGGSSGGGGGWQRPSGYPDLYSLNISNEEALYITYRANNIDGVDSFASFQVTSSGSYTVEIGTVNNGTFTAISSETLASNTAFMKWLVGYSVPYVVIRITGTITKFEKKNFTLDGNNFDQGTQYMVEVYGRLPNLTELYRSSFAETRELESVKLIDMQSVTTLERAFYNSRRLENVYISGVVQRCKGYYAFALCKDLQYVYCNGIKLGDVQNLFDGSPVRYSDFEGWDVVWNGNCSSVFANTLFKSYDLRNWDITTTTPTSCFKETRAMRYVDISTWTVSGNAPGMFNNSGVEEIPTMSSWSNITNIANLFSGSMLTGKITMPSTGVTDLGTSLQYLNNVESITIPNTYTNIPAQAFRDASNCEEIHFLATTPPTLANSNAFTTNMNANLKIYVPYSADHSVLTAYQTASNWSSVASKIVEEAQ